MATKPEIERLAVLETKVDTILEAQGEMNKKLDLILPTFVTKEEHEKQLGDLKKEIEAAKRKSSLQVWITATLSAAFGVLLTLLLGYFVANISKDTAANNPTETTTTTTPTGSTSKTTDVPSASATANAQADSEKDSESVIDGVLEELPKVLP